jgi:tetratricopeptide (TPR) repeat protein
VKLERWLAELDQLLAAGRREAAETIIQDKLAELKASGEQHGSAYLSLLNELASFYRGTSRLPEAQQAFSELEQALTELGQAESLPYVAVQINLAGTYRLMDNPDQALSHYASAQICLGQLRLNSKLTAAEQARLVYLTASVLNNISLLYNDLEQLDTALDYANQAAQMIRGGVGEEHELATTCNNLASIYLKLERYAEAEAAIAEALEIYARMPQENVHHAAALATQAALLFRNGDLDGAEAALLRSLDLTEHFFGQNADYQSTRRSLQTVREARETPINSSPHLLRGP